MGGALCVHQGGVTLVAALWCCTWGRGREGVMAPAPLSTRFQSFTPLPTMKLGPSGAGSRVGGLVHALGPRGSLQRPLLWGWEFLPPPQPPQVFTMRDYETFFPGAGTLGCAVCLAPQLLLLVYPQTNVGSLGLPAAATPARFSSLGLATTPLLPSCLLPPLIPVWMNVSTLTPWLLDFHTVQFSGSSGYFLFLNLLSFWSCKEAKRIYLCLLVGSINS